MSKRRFLILGRILVVTGVILAAVILSAGLFLSRQYVVPVLMYHSITPEAHPDSMLAVSVKTFDRQMRFLKARHYNVVPLETLIDLIRQRKKIPRNTVVLTLDDGYKDNYLYAYPVLKKYGLPATVFIIVNEVGRPQNDRLGWDQILQMQGSGVINFGSHAIGPDPLVKAASEKELRHQIFDSKMLLEKRLGRPVEVFSYPEGMFNHKIRQMVIDAGYKGAVATNPGPYYPDDDIYALKRLRISENASNMFVFAVESSGYYTFMKEWKKRKK